MVDKVHLRHPRTGANVHVLPQVAPRYEENGFERVEDDAAQEPESTETDLRDLTNDELRERLADQDLPVSGTKDELVARLEDNE